MTTQEHDPMAYFHDLFCEAGCPPDAQDVRSVLAWGQSCVCDVRRNLAKSIILEGERHRALRKGYVE